MTNENLPDENATEKQTDEQIDRRTVAVRAGKFLAYTAPALVALITAKDASASQCGVLASFARLRRSMTYATNANLERHVAPIAIANADRFDDLGHKDLSVADLAGAGRVTQKGDDFFGPAIRNHNLHFHLGQQVDLILLSAIGLFVPFLPAVAAHFTHGHPFNADTLHRGLHLVQFERLDDRFDFLHFSNLSRYWTTASRTRADNS